MVVEATKMGTSIFCLRWIHGITCRGNDKLTITILLYELSENPVYTKSEFG
jgi:hypothetical protein